MNDTFMKEKPVFPLILSMALPMVISMLVNSLYNTLEDFFVGKVDSIYSCEQKNNRGITDSKTCNVRIRSKKSQESRHHKDTADCQNNAMQGR